MADKHSLPVESLLSAFVRQKRMVPLSTLTANTFQAISSNINSYHLNNFKQVPGVHKSYGVVKSFAKKSSKEDGSRAQKRNLHSAVSDKSKFRDDIGGNSNGVSSIDGLDVKNPISGTSRGVVLQACTVTSGLILALGLVIRQISHIAFTEGFPVVDCSTEVSLNFETWHIELIIGLVILISSCRYLLLQTWSDFAESSEAANQQVLSSLQPMDYLVVAFLPGISEEFLFRGALLPLFGLNWKGALVVALIFGALHLGSGRKYSFAIWATFVGLAYGYATILSSSVIVPVTSHALNNLVGGVLWLYTSNTLEEK